MKRLLTRTPVALPLAFCVGLCLTAAGSGVAARASDTLDVRATFVTRYVPESCPAGTPPGATCRRHSDAAPVRGLGTATESYLKVVGDERVCPPESPILQPRSAVLEVARKGGIEISLPGPICLPSGPGRVAPLNATISGGFGRYAGASGTLVFESSVSTIGTTRDEWTGSLSVPGFEFDVTPPVLSGARSRTIRAPKKAKRVRVAFAVTARDTVDGVVPVACTPRSGTRVKLGRTLVRCLATDSSANTAKKSFVITVKKPRR